MKLKDKITLFVIVGIVCMIALSAIGSALENSWITGASAFGSIVIMGVSFWGWDRSLRKKTKD